MGPVPQACDDPAELKAAYRFFQNEAVAPAALLERHVQATVERVAAVPLVLAVQDTTEISWAATDQPALWVHRTLALTPERVPVGLRAQETWTRPPEEAGKIAARVARCGNPGRRTPVPAARSRLANQTYVGGVLPRFVTTMFVHGRHLA